MSKVRALRSASHLSSGHYGRESSPLEKTHTTFPRNYSSSSIRDLVQPQHRMGTVTAREVRAGHFSGDAMHAPASTLGPPRPHPPSMARTTRQKKREDDERDELRYAKFKHRATWKGFETETHIEDRAEGLKATQTVPDMHRLELDLNTLRLSGSGPNLGSLSSKPNRDTLNAGLSNKDLEMIGLEEVRVKNDIPLRAGILQKVQSMHASGHPPVEPGSYAEQLLIARRQWEKGMEMSKKGKKREGLGELYQALVLNELCCELQDISAVPHLLLVPGSWPYETHDLASRSRLAQRLARRTARDVALGRIPGEDIEELRPDLKLVISFDESRDCIGSDARECLQLCLLIQVSVLFANFAAMEAKWKLGLASANDAVSLYEELMNNMTKRWMTSPHVRRVYGTMAIASPEGSAYIYLTRARLLHHVYVSDDLTVKVPDHIIEKQKTELRQEQLERKRTEAKLARSSQVDLFGRPRTSDPSQGHGRSRARSSMEGSTTPLKPSSPKRPGTSQSSSRMSRRTRATSGLGLRRGGSPSPSHAQDDQVYSLLGDKKDSHHRDTLSNLPFFKQSPSDTTDATPARRTSHSRGRNSTKSRRPPTSGSGRMSSMSGYSRASSAASTRSNHRDSNSTSRPPTGLSQDVSMRPRPLRSRQDANDELPAGRAARSRSPFSKTPPIYQAYPRPFTPFLGARSYMPPNPDDMVSRYKQGIYNPAKPNKLPGYDDLHAGDKGRNNKVVEKITVPGDLALEDMLQDAKKACHLAPNWPRARYMRGLANFISSLPSASVLQQAAADFSWWLAHNPCDDHPLISEAVYKLALCDISYGNLTSADMRSRLHTGIESERACKHLVGSQQSRRKHRLLAILGAAASKIHREIPRGEYTAIPEFDQAGRRLDRGPRIREDVNMVLGNSGFAVSDSQTIEIADGRATSKSVCPFAQWGTTR